MSAGTRCLATPFLRQDMPLTKLAKSFHYGFALSTSLRRSSEFLMSRITVAFSLLAVAACCPADDLSPTQASFRPTSVPDRVLLSWKGDPATTQSVTWRTDDSVASGVAEIAPAGPGPDFKNDAKSIEARTEPLKSNLGEAHYHSVTFEGLKPATAYAYRVGDGETWSEWFQFRTMSAEPAPLQFVYVGDAQNDLKSLWSRVIRQAYSDAPKSQFLLHAGDLINRGDADHEWGEWFYGLGWMSGTIPQIAIPGNHEYSKISKDSPKGLTAHWKPQFELPENGPMGLEESVFFIDVQGVRIVGLNSNEDQEMQAEWLDDVLSKNPNRWTIVAHHHPIHSTSGDRDNAQLRRLWQPTYDRHGVDVVLQGHAHSYGRSRPIRFDANEEQVSKDEDEKTVQKIADGENVASGVRGRTPGGTVYVVSVSGPKMYALKDYPKETDPFARRAADTQLYQIITIDGDELKYEARTAVGDLYDAFSLKKRADAPNEFIERVPKDVEQRLGKTTGEK